MFNICWRPAAASACNGAVGLATAGRFTPHYPSYSLSRPTWRLYMRADGCPDMPVTPTHKILPCSLPKDALEAISKPVNISADLSGTFIDVGLAF